MHDPVTGMRSARTTKLLRLATDGTPYIVLGTVVASLGAYVYQVVGGRALGPADFDPVTALLTVHFLIFTVLLMPVEQYTIRRLTLERRSGRGAVAIVVIASAAGAAIFTLLERDRFFAGESLFAVISVVAVVGNSLLALGRGRLAGMRRYRDYGLVSGLTGVLRILLALGFLAIATSALSLGWALALAPFVVLAWRPFRSLAAAPSAGSDDPESAGRFLGGFVLATAASQVLLLASPLMVRVLDDSPGLMSVVFVTFQLFRAPIVMAQNLLARLLPPFTNLAAIRADAELRKWAIRFGVAGMAAAVPAGIGAAWLGPPIVRLLFGAEFEPSATVAGVAAAGMIMAAASLFASQILVARGQTLMLAGAWGLGFAAAVAGLVLTEGGADVRVAIAFMIGEAAALVFTAAAGMRSSSHLAEPGRR